MVNLLLVAGLLSVLAACVCKSDRDSNYGSGDEPPVVDSSNVSAPAVSVKAKNEDRGDFVVEYAGVTNARYNALDREIKREKLLEKAADQLNRSLVLPGDVVIRARDCGDINASYEPGDRSVTICYELMEHLYSVFRRTGASDEQAYRKMFEAVRFVFLHEVAHALIDVYQLNITGSEEDAADRCAAFINLKELGSEGANSVFAVAEAFALDTRSRHLEAANEHLLQEQRFFNSICMIYGSDPGRYNDLVTKGILPQDRAERCPAEYRKAVESWTNLLEPWRKN